MLTDSDRAERKRQLMLEAARGGFTLAITFRVRYIGG